MTTITFLPLFVQNKNSHTIPAKHISKFDMTITFCDSLCRRKSFYETCSKHRSKFNIIIMKFMILNDDNDLFIILQAEQILP